MSSNPPRRTRHLILAGIILAPLAFLIEGRTIHSHSPAPAAVPQLASPPGVVCRSAHFTLTAEIHAG